MKKFFLDTEFLEGVQRKYVLGIPYGYTKPTIDLISIAIVSETGEEYYAICKDFNLREVWNRCQRTTHSKEPKHYWHREKVLKPIFDYLLEKENLYFKHANGGMIKHRSFTYKNMKKLLSLYGKEQERIKTDVLEFFYQSYTEKFDLYGYYADYDWVCFCWIFGIMMNLPPEFPYYCKDLKQMLDDKGNPSISHLKSTKAHDALEDARFNKKLYDYIQNL